MTALNFTSEQRTTVTRYLEQKEWIEAHGNDLDGYCERYGRAEEQPHYGNGGEAIYAADKAAFDRLAAKVAAFFGGRNATPDEIAARWTADEIMTARLVFLTGALSTARPLATPEITAALAALPGSVLGYVEADVRDALSRLSEITDKVLDSVGRGQYG